ncbi:YraN family protein [Microbacterium sp. 1.5R]|uniref:YraN family protein n=1 Tax=Microbacterium sp. 1.5R TaxID=1916917 RepID=UPI00119FAA29|nr:YraN family protein [Microbacterium sp. 1.5R]
MAAKDELGRAGEARAAQHLLERGYEILSRNWRCAQGEIDIVAVSAGWLCIIEVKTRSSAAFGHPLEAVDSRKLGRLWQLAYAWVAAHPDRARGLTLRVEAVSLIGSDPASAEIEHLVDLS